MILLKEIRRDICFFCLFFNPLTGALFFWAHAVPSWAQTNSKTELVFASHRLDGWASWIVDGSLLEDCRLASVMNPRVSSPPRWLSRGESSAFFFILNARKNQGRRSSVNMIRCRVLRLRWTYGWRLWPWWTRTESRGGWTRRGTLGGSPGGGDRCMGTPPPPTTTAPSLSLSLSILVFWLT